MAEFDPVKHIAGSATVVGSDGLWPNFHDAEVHSLNFWRGDMRPNDDVWIAAVIEATLELCALEFPFVVVMKFHDCDEVEMSDFNHSNQIQDLSFAFEERGHYTDGVTPLPPYVRVTFHKGFGVHLRFRCFRVEVCARREVEKKPYA
jgi:hypothetical protein